MQDSLSIKIDHDQINEYLKKMYMNEIPMVIESNYPVENSNSETSKDKKKVDLHNSNPESSFSKLNQIGGSIGGSINTMFKKALTKLSKIVSEGNEKSTM